MGTPSGLGLESGIEVLQPVDYQSKPWMLMTDKVVKADKIRLVSADGEMLEFGKPPSTVQPTHFLAHGHALYALATARSQTEGQTDVLVLRWGSDPRPRMTTLGTASVVDAAPRAAMVGEYMAIVWGQTAADGKSHLMASFLDVEDIKVRTPTDLGVRPADGFVDIATVDKNFVVLWDGAQATQRATFDGHGKSAVAAAALTWAGRSTLRGTVHCGARTWLLHDAPGAASADKPVVLSASDASGSVTEVARVPAPPTHEAMPLVCVDDAVAIAHRTVSAKEGNVIFWLTTVEAGGKVHDRRVKDVKGTLDDIRFLQLVATGEQRVAFWVEGKGADTKLWSRAVSCE
jgi:hypothetical protein